MYRGPLKNNARRSGGRNTPGASRRVGYSLGGGGVASVGLEMGQDIARDPGTPGGRHVQSSYKHFPVGRGAKRRLGPRDGCAIALEGGEGAWRLRDSEWG